MSKSKPEAQLVAALKDAQTTVPGLQNIRKLAVLHDAPDATAAMAAMAEGCVLLGISCVADDEDGEGFRYLLGLPHGVRTSGYLSNFFGQDFSE